jgi:hypothetical protein
MVLVWLYSPANLTLVLDRKTFSVPVTCPACERLVTIAYVAPVGDYEVTTYHWQCPYVGCTGKGTFRLHGEFLGASPGLPSYFGNSREGVRRFRESPLTDEQTDPHHVGLTFLRTEIDTGMTFAGLATNTHEDPARRARNRQHAKTAAETVERFLPEVIGLTTDEFSEIADGLDRLRRAIAVIPA